MEWIVAVAVFLVVCGLVIGIPIYLAMTSWSARDQRRAAAARRARAAGPSELDPRIVPSSVGHRTVRS